MTKIQDRQSVFGESHVQYINREAAFKQRGGCMYKAHHLPPWAKNSPKIFFAAADKYERANGERYKEIEFALPNELSLDQQKEIVERFVNKHLSDFYYAYAVHDKIGSMSNGERHPHVHIMICTRKLDDIEKNNPRDAKTFFKRANADNPEKGGCPKDENWIGKQRSLLLKEMRQSCAEIQNDVLKKNGYAVTVDHRSLKAQRKAALAEGNFFLAELLDRIPESSVGPIAQLEKENELIIKQRLLRQGNYKRQIMLCAKNALKETIRKADYTALKIKNQKAFLKLQSDLNDIVFPSEETRQLWENELVKLCELREKIETQSNLAVWYEDAILEARLEQMTASERESWQKFKSLGEDLKLWREYRERYVNSPEATDKRQILEAIDRQIDEVNRNFVSLANKIRPVFIALNNEPYKTKAQKLAGKILFENGIIKYKLEKLEEDFNKKVEYLAADLEKLYAAKEEYSNNEVNDNLDSDIKSILSKLSLKRKEYWSQKKKIISQDRAIFIAKDVFTKQGFKKLRLKKRKLQEQQKKGVDLQQLNKLEREIKKEEAELNKKCSAPDAVNKIHKIASGILRKNISEVEKCKALKTEVTILEAKLSDAKSRSAIAKQVPAGTKYKTAAYTASSPAPPTSLRDARAIADGLSGNEKIAQLIAYSDTKNSMGLDNWNMLSEFEKSKRLAEAALRD